MKPLSLLAFTMVMMSTFAVMADQDAFPGVIGRTLPESEAAWPKPLTAPENAPNVVIFLLDDAGYSHLQPYGGITETPTIERLANNGLVSADFHSVPLCSPARAALLAGRNHHSVAMGSHVMSPAGFPGYFGRIPKSAASLATHLRENGYATFALGKWDQTPATEASQAGPYVRWPSGQGFDRFYGFIGAEMDHFSPSLWSDHTPVSPASPDNPDYFLTTDLADQAIGYISGLRAIKPDQPFLLYFSTGAVHDPHHAPREYIEKYRDTFALGWDELREKTLSYQLENGIVPKGTRLSPPHEEIPRWEDLPAEEQRLYAQQMAAFAGQLDHTDHQFGRIVKLIEDLGELDNTIIVVLSDNGASAEGGMTGLHNFMLTINGQTTTFERNNAFYDVWGGPQTGNHFHTGWAMAGNSPFPYFKHHVDGGGTHIPMIVHWPKRITKTGVRTQFHHIIDVAPTILDAIGLEPSDVIDGVKQQPLDGISMAYTFDDASAPAQRTLQYFEVWGNRGIYKDGWRATTIHNDIMPWERPIPGKLEDDVWRLYHVADDFSQSEDLAAKMPDKLVELQAAWEVEAKKYGVYPIDPDRRTRTRAQLNNSGRKESRIVYQRSGSQRIPEALSPPTKNKSFSITADVSVKDGRKVNGVIATAGGKSGGYSLYVKGGHPTYVFNLYNESHFYVRSKSSLPDGDSQLRFDFEKNDDNNGGVGTLYINGQEVGKATINETTNIVYNLSDGFDIGQDSGSSASPEYPAPFRFNGEIDQVIFDLK